MKAGEQALRSKQTVTRAKRESPAELRGLHSNKTGFEHRFKFDETIRLSTRFCKNYRCNENFPLVQGFSRTVASANKRWPNSRTTRVHLRKSEATLSLFLSLLIATTFATEWILQSPYRRFNIRMFQPLNQAIRISSFILIATLLGASLKSPHGIFRAIYWTRLEFDRNFLKQSRK